MFIEKRTAFWTSSAQSETPGISLCAEIEHRLGYKHFRRSAAMTQFTSFRELSEGLLRQSPCEC
jgi:hypothetical protein